MKAFILLVLVVGAAVGGYAYFGAKNDRGDIGDPVLSASPTGSPAASPSSSFTNGTYRLVAASSSMQWEAKKTLIVNYTDRGTVALKEGSATVKGGAVVSGSVVVDLTTITTLSTGKGSGESMQEKHIKGPDFFDVEKYPTATFAFNSLAAVSGGYRVKGTLTVKGIEQPIEFPATIVGAGDTLTMQATATLDRTLWGIKYASGKFFQGLGDKVIDDMFTISFTVVGTLKK